MEYLLIYLVHGAAIASHERFQRDTDEEAIEFVDGFLWKNRMRKRLRLVKTNEDGTQTDVLLPHNVF